VLMFLMLSCRFSILIMMNDDAENAASSLLYGHLTSYEDRRVTQFVV